MGTSPLRATSWMPAQLPTPDAAFLAKVKLLYARDTVLSQSLDDALSLQNGAPVPKRGRQHTWPVLHVVPFGQATIAIPWIGAALPSGTTR